MGASFWPRLGVASLAVAAVLAVTFPAAEARRARGVATDDSGRVVRHVRVSTGGIHVDVDDLDTVLSGAKIQIGPTGIMVDDDGSGLVRLFSDVHVEKGQHVVGEAVAVFGSVTVDGEVSGDVVAVFGSVKLGPGAIVDGDVVSVGGEVDRAPDAQVHGDTVGLAFLPILTWGLPPLPAIAVALFVGWLLTLFMGWLVTLIFPERFVAIAATASSRSGASFLLGVASGPLFFLTVILLCITVIGIPLAFLLPMIYVVVVFVGQLAATYVLGCKLLFRRQRPEEGRALMPALALGSGFVLGFFLLATLFAAVSGPGRLAALFFAALGCLMLCGLSAIGTGAALLSRGGSPQRMAAAGGASPPGPSSPVGAPPMGAQPAPPSPVA